MIYKKLSVDDITQLEFQAGKRAAEIIDALLQKIDGIEARIEALEDTQKPDESEGTEI